MHASKIDLSEDARASAVKLLQPRLAAAIDLNSQAKQAHWNVTGPNFMSLHKLFDVVADEVANHADLIAERIATLGGLAEGTARVAAERSGLPAYPLTITSGPEHIDALSSALAGFGRSLRSAIDLATAAGDHGTADLLTEICSTTERFLWLVEVHARDDGELSVPARSRSKKTVA